MRIGFGKDIHKLEKGTGLVIGGILIPCEFRSVAHSDGDALIHAISDAILGAAALNDIGYYFPDNDKNTENMDSKIILSTVLNLINGQYNICNIDCVVTLEKPKLSNVRNEIIQSVGKLLNLDTKKISIKFKTNEGLGDIGKSKAYEAEAICLLEDK